MKWGWKKKWCFFFLFVHVCSVLSDSATPWTAAHYPPLSMGFSRQEYLEWVAISSPMGLKPGILRLLHWQVNFFLSLNHLGSPFLLSSWRCFRGWILPRVWPWPSIWKSIEESLFAFLTLPNHSLKFPFLGPDLSSLLWLPYLCPALSLVAYF